MSRYRTTWDWQQTDNATGRVMSGESFVCCHCGCLHDVVFGESPAMCDSEWLPLCPGCSAVFHGAGENHRVCPVVAAKASFIDRMHREHEERLRFMRSIGM